MYVIDVNSGKNIKGRDFSKTILQTNIEAAKECGRQIKLRNLSGIILIDFIDLRDNAHKPKVINELKKDNQILADKVNSLNKKSRNTHQIVKQDNSKNSLLSLQDLLNTSRSNEDNHSSNRDVVSRMKKRIDFLSEENKTFKKQVEVLAKINEELMNKTKNDQKEKDQLGETILRKEKKIVEYRSLYQKMKSGLGSVIYNQYEYLRNAGNNIFNTVCNVLSTEDTFVKGNSN